VIMNSNGGTYSPAPHRSAICWAISVKVIRPDGAPSHACYIARFELSIASCKVRRVFTRYE
jgi:hypothetical protein